MNDELIYSKQLPHVLIVHGHQTFMQRHQMMTDLTAFIHPAQMLAH